MFAAVQRTLGLVLLTLACSAGAEVLETLYQDSVAVADQSRSGLSRAARQGLERVLVRVSGEREVSQQDGVRQALARADQLLDAYHYERNDPPPGEEGEEGEEALPWRVQLSFSESGVQRLLQEVGLPLWPANRPVVLTWLVLDRHGERQLAGREQNGEWLEQWNRAAEERGLILRWPLLDLVDRANLSTSAAWQLNTERAWQASERYRADAVLLCRVAVLSDERWLGNCRFNSGDVQQDTDIGGASAEDYAQQVVHHFADRLAARYAIAPLTDEAGTVLLQFSGVERFEQYAHLLAMLAGLAPVRELALVSAEQDRLVVALTLGTGVDRLQSALGLERELRAEGQVPIAYQGRSLGGLHYRWKTAEPRS